MMIYSDGQKVRIGDKVDLGGAMFGVVICSFDDQEFGPDFSESEWSELKEGVLVKSEQAGLIHYVKADQDFLLVERGS